MIKTNQWRIQEIPDGKVPTPKWGRQPIILVNCSENCMKMQKNGLRGEG